MKDPVYSEYWENTTFLPTANAWLEMHGESWKVIDNSKKL